MEVSVASERPVPAAPESHAPGHTRAAAWLRFEPYLYAVFSGVCVLYAARTYYGALFVQTGGTWSAPLDDVFIHFDYARATARGFPFQWSEGNGYSSGNTSILYPFVLALGYLLGFRSLDLMQWAAYVACVATFAYLIFGAKAFARLGAAAKYALPPALLSLGALNWSLFSGMENALHLGLWAIFFSSSWDLACEAESRPIRFRRALRSGLWGALLFLTRPESVVCVAAFAFYVGGCVARRRGFGPAIKVVAAVALPGALALVVQSLSNWVFTGEVAANGAIAKLALNNPYMNGEAKLAEYWFHLKYAVYRNIEYHFADTPSFGYLVVATALIPLTLKRTRPVALLIWVQMVGWLALVAFNGQVRWQNERYTMAAVAWVFTLAAMGIAIIVGNLNDERWWLRFARPVGAALIVYFYWMHQLPKMRDQIWFFARASRNIRDQHITAGRLLKGMNAKRVLVGDAGAMTFAADVPGLDLIGLGGYQKLPLARATVHGIGASLELIERMPASERPDTMALYPSWWADLPAIFGHQVTSVPVMGNVICGGAEKVIYRADWSPLDSSGTPRSLRRGEVIVDELDVADLVNEREHSYVFPRPDMGYVGYRVLEDPAVKGRDLFDAGRLIPKGQRESANLRVALGGGRLIVRTALSKPVEVEVTVDDRVLGRIALTALQGWAEASIDLPDGLPATVRLGLQPMTDEWTNYHVWVVAPEAVKR